MYAPWKPNGTCWGEPRRPTLFDLLVETCHKPRTCHEPSPDRRGIQFGGQQRIHVIPAMIGWPLEGFAHRGDFPGVSIVLVTDGRNYAVLTVMGFRSPTPAAQNSVVPSPS